MHRIVIVSKDRKARVAYKKKALSSGFIYDQRHPEIVITYGGDGTLLHAERLYPGVPKLPLKNSPTSRKSHDHPFEHALAALTAGRVRETRQEKLLIVAKRGRTVIGRSEALNDACIRNRDATHAIRFSVAVDRKAIAENLIGDGVVVSTPFGSTAYFFSITKETFDIGFGIAFNNVPVDQSYALIDTDCTVTVTLERGPADLTADNGKVALLRTGDTVLIKRAARPARLLSLR